jgi:hypothetical protein
MAIRRRQIIEEIEHAEAVPLGKDDALSPLDHRVRSAQRILKNEIGEVSALQCNRPQNLGLVLWSNP